MTKMTFIEKMITEANKGNTKAQAYCFKNPDLFSKLKKNVQETIMIEMVKSGKVSEDVAAKLFGSTEALKEKVYDMTIANVQKQAVEAAATSKTTEAVSQTSSSQSENKSRVAQEEVSKAAVSQAKDVQAAKAEEEQPKAVEMAAVKPLSSEQAVACYQQAVENGVVPRAPIAETDEQKEARKKLIEDVKAGKSVMLCKAQDFADNRDGVLALSKSQSVLLRPVVNIAKSVAFNMAA